MIKINLEKAKEIHKDKIREARKPLLEKLDVDFVRALETNGDTSSITEQKQELRDATVLPDTISNTEDLKQSWNESLLGPSPY